MAWVMKSLMAKVWMLLATYAAAFTGSSTQVKVTPTPRWAVGLVTEVAADVLVKVTKSKSLLKYLNPVGKHK
jgi:hypothetical protein